MKKLGFAVFFASVVLAVAVSCKKDLTEEAVSANDIAKAEEGSTSRYMYILNEGVWGGNDASLDRINLASGEYQRNIFGSANGRDLGDVANDMQIYGSKMYIVVNNSNIVEVLNPENARSVCQIQLAGKQPRYVVAHEGFVYVSCYTDEVLKIDTATFSVVGTCAVGKDPEMMAVIGQKLYVVNSGGLDNPNYDSTISVVSLDSFAEVRKVTVGLNPTKIMKIDESRLLIVCNGNYDSIPSSMAVYNIGTNAVTKLAFSCTNFLISNGYAYCYDFDWGSHAAVYYRVNLSNFAKENLTIDGTGNIECPYGIAVNKGNGNMYITDSRNFLSNGDIHCYSATGTLRYSHECGMGPSKVVMW